MTLQAIRWNDGKLDILDQLKLPDETTFIPVKNVEDGWQVINKMQVRGAPAIAIVGCLSVAAELAHGGTQFKDKCELHKAVTTKLEYLVSARPTAVNMKKAADELTGVSESLCTGDTPLEDMLRRIINWCETMLQDDITTNKKIGKFGADAIVSNKNTVQVMTHCNTGSLATAGYGTALGVIRAIHDMGLLGKVYSTETRPYNQGSRLTAYELVYEKMPGVLICDSMVGALMRSTKIDAVVVGADRVARNGDTANKIGTYQLAVNAHHHNIPFYVCAPTTSIDLSLEDGSGIPIEERPHTEMTHTAGIRIAAAGISCWNPAFDVTPANLITGIVTELGVFEPSQLYENVKDK